MKAKTRGETRQRARARKAKNEIAYKTTGSAGERRAKALGGGEKEAKRSRAGENVKHSWSAREKVGGGKKLSL